MPSSIRFTRRFGAASLVMSTILAASAASAADVRVGPTQTYKTLAAGVAAAAAGDRVLLDAGTYSDDAAIVSKPLTIEGAGAGATLQATRPISNGKGILVVGASLTVRNLTFKGAVVADGNGAGIRLEAGDLTVENAAFIDNQDGLLANPNPSAIITITKSTFSGNGSGDGRTHGIYVNEVAQLTVHDSSFAGTKAGHDIKSRALRTSVVNTVLDDGVSGSTSYAVDFANGGVAVLDNVRITQGANTQNPLMVAFGAEGSLKAASSLTIVNSSFTNLLGGTSATGVWNFTSIPVTLTNNTVSGLPAFLHGAGTVAAAANGAPVRQGGVYSTLQGATQSYLRLYNAGAYAGTASITLADAATGQTLTTWQSPPIAPNAAIQVPVVTIEGAATSFFAKPAFYIATIQGTFTGSMQHIVYRPSSGTIANLTGCDSGVGNNGQKLANVHSSLLSSLASQVLITNTGVSNTAVTFGIYDARDGRKLGTYTSPPVAAGGGLSVSVPSMESGARFTPPAGALHYTLAVESTFTGTLQHLLGNGAATEDVTTVCALRAS